MQVEKKVVETVQLDEFLREGNIVESYQCERESKRWDSFGNPVWELIEGSIAFTEKDYSDFIIAIGDAAGTPTGTPFFKQHTHTVKFIGNTMSLKTYPLWTVFKAANGDIYYQIGRKPIPQNPKRKGEDCILQLKDEKWYHSEFKKELAEIKQKEEDEQNKKIWKLQKENRLLKEEIVELKAQLVMFIEREKLTGAIKNYVANTKDEELSKEADSLLKKVKAKVFNGLML